MVASWAQHPHVLLLDKRHTAHWGIRMDNLTVGRKLFPKLCRPRRMDPDPLEIKMLQNIPVSKQIQNKKGKYNILKQPYLNVYRLHPDELSDFPLCSALKGALHLGARSYRIWQVCGNSFSSLKRSLIHMFLRFSCFKVLRFLNKKIYYFFLKKNVPIQKKSITIF